MQLGFRLRHFHAGLTGLSGAIIAIAFDRLAVSTAWGGIAFGATVLLLGCLIAKIDIKLEEERAEQEHLRDQRDVCEYLELIDMYIWDLASDLEFHVPGSEFRAVSAKRPRYRDFIDTQERHDRVRRWFFCHNFEVYLDSVDDRRADAQKAPMIDWKSRVGIAVRLRRRFLGEVKRQHLFDLLDWEADSEEEWLGQGSSPSPGDAAPRGGE